MYVSGETFVKCCNFFPRTFVFGSIGNLNNIFGRSIMPVHAGNSTIVTSPMLYGKFGNIIATQINLQVFVLIKEVHACSRMEVGVMITVNKFVNIIICQPETVRTKLRSRCYETCSRSFNRKNEFASVAQGISESCSPVFLDLNGFQVFEFACVNRNKLPCGNRLIDACRHHASKATQTVVVRKRVQRKCVFGVCNIEATVS